jgi:NADPH-dependent ferric siderophore reductase
VSDRPETRQRSRPVPIPVTVRSARRLSPTMVRITLGGIDLHRFRPSEFTDSYVKLTFPRPGADYPEPFDLGQIKATFPARDWPVVRTYTVRDWDPDRHALTIDFVVHGDHGVAGPWASSARPGDRIYLTGPGGAFAPDPAASWHLLVGDESALPAIAAAVDALPPTARGHVLVEVPGPASEIDLPVPAGVALTWVHTGASRLGSRLVEWVAAVDFPDDEGQAFVHGEAGFVAELRRYLRVDRGMPRDRLSISGYWRFGATEEGWRAAKAEWNAAAEDVERRAGVA